jgi:flagella basal body P-ring formation protein FlgA
MMAALAALSCITVAGPHILGRDLARAGVHGVPSDAIAGFAPAPGARRVFSQADLASLARKHGLTNVGGDVCFEREMKPLGESRIVDSMRQALASPEAGIDLVDWTRRPLPDGELIFRREDLKKPASGDTARWDGWLRFEPTRRIRISTTLRVRAPRDVLVAAAALPSGAVLAAGDVRAERRMDFPDQRPSVTPAGVLGQRLIRPLAAGAEIKKTMLAVEPEIRKGDPIQVEVTAGSARLKLTATAATQGSLGQWITVLNPGGGARFRARVAGRGLAVVGK